MNRNDKEKYIIVGIVSNKSTTYPQGHMAFLGKHGKNVYFTSDITDKCICKFDTRDAFRLFYNTNKNKIKEEVKFWCIEYLYLGHQGISLDNYIVMEEE